MYSDQAGLPHAKMINFLVSATPVVGQGGVILWPGDLVEWHRPNFTIWVM